MNRPDWCRQNCEFAKHSTGFVPDWHPSVPKVALVLKMPGKDEIVLGEPMTGKAGRYWEHEFLARAGLVRRDVVYANVIRCHPNSGEFPVGKLGKAACTTCRHWDAMLEGFGATVMGVTFNPAMLLRTPQQAGFLQRALQRAKEFAEAGERPMLLMGAEAMAVFAPHLKGAVKRWQGHWWRV